MNNKLIKIIAALTIVFGVTVFSSPGTADAHCTYFPGAIHKCMG